ncbi:3-hydroxybutyrate dehydrogenase [Aurantibacillus circumpalustris]|uniref:3-hydroxybutyrate dehydrogenase n=1 Tax=Aurantibacillus circumpalustris TaxID=3036359 RepID=UPI00295BB05E|nr:3-hydroxybutyrate dehydrogenase [Aurantibacillus circumpalustris]
MKTALITGSTSGIGLGIATEFAKTKQYNIIFNGLETNGAEIAASVGKEYGIETLYSGANMLKPEELRKMVTDGIAKFGKIDILINNAGIQYVSPIDEFPDEKWNAIIAINLTSAFHLSKAVWPGMKTNKFGRIINIASAHGLNASEFKSAYVASKHGIVGLTKTLGLEGAPFNITCNAICPGYVKTPLVEKQIGDQAKAHNMSESDVVNKVMLLKQAVKEFVSVETLGQMALLLAAEHSNTITGTAISIDGGWNAQ